MPKILYLDPYSINKSNYKEFESSIDWPLEEKKFHEFADKLFNSYYRLLGNIPMELTYFCLVETIMISQLINIFHYNYVLQFAKKNNISLRFSQQSKQFSEPNWEKIKDFYINYSFKQNKIKRILRRVVKFFFFNRKNKPLKLIKELINPENLSIGSFDYLKQNYTEENKILCSHYDWIDILNKNTDRLDKETLSISEKRKIYQIKNKVIRPFLLKIYSYKGNILFFKGIKKTFLEQIWINRYEDLYKIFKVSYKQKKFKTVLVSELGNPYHKVIMYSNYMKGARIISFNHGNDFGMFHNKWAHQSLISHSLKYCFETKQIKKNYEETKKLRPLEKITNTEYLSLNSNRYEEIRNKNKFRKISSPNRVMLIGFPMHINRYLNSPYSFFHYKLKIEFQVGEILKKLNYFSIYKAHPARLKQIGSIINNYDLFISKEFEKVWNDAGVIIFTSLGSSTFGYAINLPIPIVYLNSEGTPLNKKKLKLLKQRIVIINVKYTRGKYKINEKVINNAIIKARKLLNLDVVKKLMG